jgi:hypothetical protein
MNTSEFNNGRLTLGQEFSYMCTSIIRFLHGKLWNNSLADFHTPLNI